MPTSSEGSFDKVLQESPAQAEKLRKQQAPNREGIWSRSQQPREVAMSGPRFEQSIIEDQVRLSRSHWGWRGAIEGFGGAGRSKTSLGLWRDVEGSIANL